MYIFNIHIIPKIETVQLQFITCHLVDPCGMTTHLENKNALRRNVFKFGINSMRFEKLFLRALRVYITVISYVDF